MGCHKLTYWNEMEIPIYRDKQADRYKPTANSHKLTANSSKKALTSDKTTHGAYSTYIYGFNGMEKDDEVKGSGNSYDYINRFYDSRLGRFLSVDPKTHAYPFLSPYNTSNNCPIMYIDKEGHGPIIRIQSKTKSAEIKSLIIAYNSGDIKYEVLKSALEKAKKEFYTSTADILWLEKQYEKSGLDLKYDDIGWLDKEYDNLYKIPRPKVAYEIETPLYYKNDIVTIILTEETDEGKLEQNTYKINAPIFTYWNLSYTNKVLQVFDFKTFQENSEELNKEQWKSYVKEAGINIIQGIIEGEIIPVEGPVDPYSSHNNYLDKKVKQYLMKQGPGSMMDVPINCPTCNPLDGSPTHKRYIYKGWNEDTQEYEFEIKEINESEMS